MLDNRGQEESPSSGQAGCVDFLIGMLGGCIAAIPMVIVLIVLADRSLSHGAAAVWVLACNAGAAVVVVRLIRRGHNALAGGLILPWGLFALFSLGVGSCMIVK